MARSLPPLGWFRSFEAAARHLNFTAAAQEVGLTQSAISQQVRSLETRLGVALFRRQARGLVLTDDGRRLLPKVDEALRALRGATDAFDVGPGQRLLSVATSVSVAQWVIQPGLAEFLDAHPGLAVRLISTLWPDDFRTTLADVEIRFGSGRQVGAGAERLGPDGLVAVSQGGQIADLDRLPLIEAVGTASNWQGWAAHAGLNIATPARIYVDSYGAGLDLAVQGAGVALTSALLARGQIANGTVRALHPDPMAAPEGYFLAVNSATEPARAFADWIKARCE